MIGAETTDGAADWLRGFPNRLHARLDGVMRMLGLALEARARHRMAGDVLHRRSGRLDAGIDLQVTSDGGHVTATLGIAGVPYAAYQEYGFHDTQTVRAHLRTITEAFGRTIAPRPVAVRSFARRIDYPAHSFLRAALADIAPDVSAQIGAAAGEEAAS
ncbi:MAG TPA: hypothetical protein VIJ42_10700 [Stellaceae bacterium]